MSALSLRKRLDAVEKRRRDTSVFILIDEHGEPPTDGRPYRLPGESDEACLARYGIDPTRQLCIFLNLTGARRPPNQGLSPAHEPTSPLLPDLVGR